MTQAIESKVQQEEKKQGNDFSHHTNVQDFIASLGAGTVEKKLGMLLSVVAEGVILHGKGTKTGKLTLELTIKQIGEASQVAISSRISHVTPTPSGKKSEDDATLSVMHVARRGKLSEEAPREDFKGQFSLASSN